MSVIRIFRDLLGTSRKSYFSAVNCLCRVNDRGVIAEKCRVAPLLGRAKLDRIVFAVRGRENGDRVVLDCSGGRVRIFNIELLLPTLEYFVLDDFLKRNVSVILKKRCGFNGVYGTHQSEGFFLG